MDQLLYKSLTNDYKDVTAWSTNNINRELKWSKIYGAGVILYFTQSKSYMGSYRATVDGATWGTFQQTTFTQPDPGEIVARAWIDANTPITLTPVPVTSTVTSTTTNVSSAPVINTNWLIIIVAAVIVLGAILWPVRKTVFDRRRR
jgi:hypothetical protein